MKRTKMRMFLLTAELLADVLAELLAEVLVKVSAKLLAEVRSKLLADSVLGLIWQVAGSS